MNLNFKKNGFVIKKIKDKNILKKLKSIVKKHFYRSSDYYQKLSRSDLSKIALKCQKEIDKLNIMKRFHKSEKSFFKRLVDNDEILYSSGGYLRAVRPLKTTNIKENLDWHRETFYSTRKFINYAINVWIPILNVKKKNALKYIPKSHLIPDNKIKRRKYIEKINPIKKFSSEHKLGFVYAPKKILSGINLKKEQKFNTKENQFVSFSALLVHGNGKNESKDIRFAYNFGIIGASKLKNNNRMIDSKKHEYISFD